LKVVHFVLICLRRGVLNKQDSLPAHHLHTYRRAVTDAEHRPADPRKCKLWQLTSHIMFYYCAVGRCFCILYVIFNVNVRDSIGDFFLAIVVSDVSADIMRNHALKGCSRSLLQRGFLLPLWIFHLC